jgi:3-methyladenine DNA glycosylase AlkD
VKIMKKNTLQKVTKARSEDNQPNLTAKGFLKELLSIQIDSEIERAKRFFTDPDTDNKFIGVRMAGLFATAKNFMDMSPDEIEKLLESPYYEARMGAVCIMDFQARNKKTSALRKKELFDLYISRHDRIDNWDMVDRSAPYVVGGYLMDKPRKILYKLAKSKNKWERRTAIVSTYYFIRQNELDDTFAIAKLLVHDKHDLIQKAVGSWVREAGKRNKKMLIDFLNQYAPTMPRTMLRYAVEKLDKKQKEVYMNAGL